MNIAIAIILLLQCEIVFGDRIYLLSRIEDALTEHFDYYTQRCGTLVEKYTGRHAQILELPPEEQRLLVAMPHLSGMADRIIGFATTFMIALLTNRAFQMGRRPELPLLEHAFYSPFINWTRAEDPAWLREPLMLDSKSRNYPDEILSSKEYWAVNTLDDWRFQDRLLREDLEPIFGGDARTTFMVGNRGKTIRMFENYHYVKRLTKNFKLTPYNAFGCFVNYLIQPKSEIFLPVADQFEIMSSRDPDVLKISVQIRVGDWAWEDSNHHITVKSFRNFFHCAHEIELWALEKRPYKDVKWYLTTESMPLRRAAVKAWGDKIVTSLNSTLEHSAKESSVCQESNPDSPSSADHTYHTYSHHHHSHKCEVSNPGFQSAAAEWWMIGYADYHVITRYSGYGRSGAFRTIEGNVSNIFTVHNSPISCAEGDYSPLDELMYDWSGI